MEDIHYNNVIMNVIRFVNSPVSSNSYVVFVRENDDCIVIDPGSKNPEELILFLEKHRLTPSFVLLTHEHFDHVWGSNIIKEKYGSKIVCSQRCFEKISTPQNYFNLLYFNDDTYFRIEQVDIIIDDLFSVNWLGENFQFIKTPGHSSSSICIYMNNALFTGDTIMNGIKTFIKKKHEGSVIEFANSIKTIFEAYSLDTLVYPGHGDPFYLREVEDFYMNYRNCNN